MSKENDEKWDTFILHNKTRIKKCLFPVILICFSIVTSCIGPFKNFSSVMFADREQDLVDATDVFAAIEGFDCIPNFSSYETATLIDVIDGDSIRVIIQGAVFEVRYIGMNTPEYNSSQRQAAIDAAQFNKNLLSSANIYLFKDISETDKYGRLLRYVIANGKFINLELVKSGHAQAKKYFPDISCQPTFDRARN